MNPSMAFIHFICRLYGDTYDDRDEDSRIGGEHWEPGKRAAHKSIRIFQDELKNEYGISLSRSKIQKILITGDCWLTERSREIGELFDYLTREKGLSATAATSTIAADLGISAVAVSINLPYRKVVYSLEEKSKNAQRIQKCREKGKGTSRGITIITSGPGKL